MNPVRQSTLIDLLEWIRIFKPTVRALVSLTKERFMGLITEYESSKGRSGIKDHEADLWRSWEDTHVIISKHSSDKKALENYQSEK
jgi:hypothetical protein